MGSMKRTLIVQFFLLLLLIVLLGQTLQAATSTNVKDKDAIILQGFNWESYNKKHYVDITNKAQQIKDAGFNALWFPPVSYAYDGEGLYPHSRGYIPLGYTNFNSSYGSESELIQAVQKLKSFGISPIADLVFNHRGVSYYEPGHQGDNNYARFTDYDWGLWAFTSGTGQNGHGAKDTGDDFAYAFDIDITNSTVRNDLSILVKQLKNQIGFEGWRYDYVKGYRGEFVSHLNDQTKPNISIGEYWTTMSYCGDNNLCSNQDSHRQEIINWMDSTWKGINNKTADDASLAFDFTTKGILQEAVRKGEYWRLKDSQGKATGVLGWWPEKSVTFIDNHDTGSTQGHWPFGNRDQVLLGYVYILTHPGIPTVFWDHFFHWNLKKEISELIRLRKSAGIKSNSSLEILQAKQGLYVAQINKNTLVKIGKGHWSAGPEFSDPIQGHNYTIWLKSR
jgi:alpha-amylase